jgi:DNA polymerase V
MRHVEDNELAALGDAFGASVRDLRAAQRTSGYPSPAEDAAEGRLDVRSLLVKRPAATFFARMEGDAMRDAGIAEGDILVVDRSLSPALGGVVVAVVEGEMLVRRYWPSPFATYLLAAHPDYPPIRIPAEAECQIWGIVTYAIRRCAPTVQPETQPAQRK